MIWAILPLIILPALAGAMAAFFAFRFWKDRAAITGWAFLVLAMACVVTWEAGTILMLAGTRAAFIGTGAILVFFAATLLPPALFRFSLSFAGKSPRLSERIVWYLLLIVPAVTSAVLLASGANLPMQAMAGSSIPAAAFWIATVYSLVLIVLGLAIIIQSYQSASGIFHGQLTCILVAAFVPVFLHCAFLFRFGSFGILDFAPLTFIVPLAAIAVGMHWYSLFYLVPVEQGDVLRQLATGIIVLDPSQRIVSMNPAAQQMLGVLEDEGCGKPIAPFLARDAIPNQPSMVMEIHKDLIHREIGGVLRSIEIRSTPLISSRGMNRGSVMVLSDVTDRVLIQQSLNMARRNINLLTSITRHDILNQLTVIILHNEILRATVTDESLMRSLLEQEKAAKTIRRQIEFTKDYEKLGENIPAWISVERSIRRQKRHLEGRSIRLLVQAEGLEIFADPLIDRVFENLVDNSLRYGGDVTVIRLYTVQHLDGLTVVYEDDGVGIPAANKARIFQRGSGRNMGFGLFFSREILSITGISIRECGTEGEGARFEILVPWGRFRFNKDIKSPAMDNTDQS